MRDANDQLENEDIGQGIKHHEILGSLKDAIHVVDKDLKIIYQNPAFSKWLETLNLDTIIHGRKITEAFPFISAETLDEYHHVFSTGEVHFTTECTVINDNEIFTEIIKIPLIRNGGIEYVATVIRDVTKHQKSQRALKLSEERYRELYSNLSDAVFLTDVNGKIELAGDKAKALFGYSSEELIGMNFAKLVHPSMREQMISAFTTRLETGSDNPVGFEAVGVRKDGSSFTFHITNTIRYDGATALGYQSLIRDVTERKKAEAALQEQRDRAQMYLDIAGVILVALDAEGNINLINQRGLELLGYEEDELNGKNWFDIAIPEYELSRTKNVFSRIIQGEIRLEEEFENRIITKSGEEKLISWKNRFLTNSEGAIIGTLSSGEDITEIRKAETALRESEEKYRTIVEQSLVGFAIITGEPVRIPFANEPLARIAGYSVYEITTMDEDLIATLIHEEDLENIRQLVFDCQRKGEREGERMQIRLLRKDGLHAWVELTVNRIEYSGDFAVQIALVDITDRRKAEDEMKQASEALRSEKEKYQVLFDAAPIAIGVSRENGEILDVNWSMQEMLGYSNEELMKKTAVELYTKPEDRNLMRESLDAEGKVRDTEVKMRRKDGSEIDVLLNIDYVNYENELARLSTMRDITELNITKRDLEAARARAEFFNDLMAHDLNNVHQGILVGAELLLRLSDLSPDALRHTKAIRDQVSRGIQLIENVRKLSKMDRDSDLELQKLDLYGVIANAILLVQHAFPQSEIKIDIKFLPEEIIVLADEFLMDLFYNLLHNAMKYSTRGPGIIEISVDSNEEEGFVHVSISDKGPGIPDERKDAVFSRLEKGRTLGSGMGLTLVKRIAERYNGASWVEDRIPGSHSMGAKFVVKLPKM